MFALRLADDAELRPLEPWQAQEFADHIEQARAHLAPWVTFAHTVVDVDSAREILQQYADKQAADTGRIYGVWLDGTLAGGVVFRRFDAASGVCEVGVWLSPHAQGRGLITTAVRHLIDWVVRVRGIKRVEWRTVPNNTRSRAVAQRLGMTCEGVLRSASEWRGKRYDDEVWAVLADEWLAQPSGAGNATARDA
jgi:ribosomal-protein-serine acetyltransferase